MKKLRKMKEYTEMKELGIWCERVAVSPKMGQIIPNRDHHTEKDTTFVTYL